MKEYKIFTEDDFDAMVISFKKYFHVEKMLGNKFKKLRIIAKRYVKSRTPAQLRTYWACIKELKIAFERVGYRFNVEDIHQFIKREAGFTKLSELPNGKVVTTVKSISDNSEDVNISNANSLIEFILEYAATNLDYQIQIKEK